MALATSLIPGFKYEIANGDFAGEIVTIKDNKAVPDGQPNQRKVLVTTPHGDDFYILPRQLKDTPVGMASTVAATLPPTVTLSEPVMASIKQADGKNVVGMVRTMNPITDPMDDRLDHLRPSRRKWNAKGTGQYIGRDMGNGMDDIEFILQFTSDAYRADSNNAGRPASVLLKGDTQSGKTMLVEALAIAWADKLGLPKPMPIFTLSGSAGITDYDMFGQTTSYTDPETGVESLIWLPGMVELAAKIGGLLYLDECNAIDNRYTSSLHPLADHRHAFTNRNKAVWNDGQFMPEVISASLDLWIIGTFNESYAGMGKLNEAFVNRFEHMCWGYHPEVEAKLIKSGALRLLGDALRTARDKNVIRTPIGTAALQRAERNVKTFGPVMGLYTLTSMFGPQERPLVDAIIEDRAIILMLNEELRQSDAEDMARA